MSSRAGSIPVRLRRDPLYSAAVARRSTEGDSCATAPAKRRDERPKDVVGAVASPNGVT